MDRDYSKEIVDYCVERVLLQDNLEEKTCEICNEKSIFVEPFDITYRNMSHNEPIFWDVCVFCKYGAMSDMDERWREYYSECF